MSYTPDEMRNMDIKLVNQGYDPDTVDDILEDVAAQTDELLKKISRLESELQGSKAQQAKMVKTANLLMSWLSRKVIQAH